ncbi:hypothetical protein Sango_2078900 [Sesamum angolense]|uniref:Uncharacterized protein n=1 Tax=Sesamum angolense TaxID=2727404 RepID=A0AAE2BLV3_9LAMI|nr:hypothetical protein Sango_2078900 [Sesamum angolense]
MHIEKNMFDNIFNTVMNIKGKTKDNLNIRKNLKIICKRPKLDVDERRPNVMPIALYTLTKEQKMRICEWISHLKFPDGYASNLARCVDMKEMRLHGMKSHDCHVFMLKFIPIVFREMLPEPVWSALIEISLRLENEVENKAHVEASIVESYLVEEMKKRWLNGSEQQIIETYIFQTMKLSRHTTNNQLLKLHCWGHTVEVTKFSCYFVNGHNFHTERHSIGRQANLCNFTGLIQSNLYEGSGSAREARRKRE